MLKEEIEKLLFEVESALKREDFLEAERLARSVTDKITRSINLVDTSISINDSLIFHSKALLLLSNSLSKRGFGIEALPFAQMALKISNDIRYQSGSAYAFFEIGKIYFESYELTTALENYNLSYSLYKELNNLSQLASVSRCIGIIHCCLNDYQTALEFMFRAASQFKEQGMDSDEALVLSNIGQVYIVMNDYQQALENILKSLSISETLKINSLIALNLSLLGNVYLSIGDYTRSLEYYYRSLSMHEELGILSGIAIVNSNIGNIYYSLSDFNRALEFYEKAKVLHVELDMKIAVAQIVCKIGMVHSDLLNFEVSLEYYLKSLSLSLKLEYKDGIAKSSNFIGLHYLEHKDYDRALLNLDKALTVSKEIEDSCLVAEVMGNLAVLYSEKMTKHYNFSKAEKYLQESFGIFLKLGRLQQQYEILGILPTLYEKEGDYAKAIEYAKKHHELYIEVQNEEVKKQADKFAWERKISDMNKEREIELLKSEAEKALLEETIIHQKKRLETQAYEVENSIQELVKKNGLLQQIQSDIRKIAPHTKHEGIDYIEQLLDRVSRHITPLDSVKELDKQWTVIHSCFIKNLQQSFPDLTTMELKIAVLLNMKFTSANIGSALFLAKRTVEFHRHNLRKKMRLETNDDIYQVLATYASQ